MVVLDDMPLPHVVPSDASPSPDQVQIRPTLRDIFCAGYTTADDAPLKYRAIASAVPSFELLSGSMPVEEITIATVADFVKQLFSCGLSNGAVRRHLLTLSSVVLSGKQSGLLPLDLPCPFDLYGKTTRGRMLLHTWPRAFRPADFECLFSSRLNEAGQPDALDPLAGRFWAPLLGLFTDAKGSELGRAQVSDIEPHDGAWGLRVTHGSFRYTPNWFVVDSSRTSHLELHRSSPMSNHSPLLDLAGLGRLLGRSPNTIRRDQRRNPDAVPPRIQLPGTRLLRWREAVVIAWLDFHVVASAEPTETNHG